MSVLDYIMGMKAAESSGGGESNDFIITLSYNETSQMYEPDKTFAEVFAAEEAEKNIIVTPDEYGSGDVSATFFIHHDSLVPLDYVGYYVTVYNYDDETEVETLTVYYCEQSSDNYSMEISGIYYGTSDADAEPSDVASGKIFYTSTGRAEGTAS